MVLNAYSVVRSARKGVDQAACVPFSERLHLCYQGFQRDPFGNMDELYREKKLPDNLVPPYAKVRAFRNAGLYNYFVTDSYEDAGRMRDYLNSLGGRREVIGLCSPVLEKALGRQALPRGDATLLGYDVDADGYSAVLTCFFERSELFVDEERLLNEYGLLRDADAAQSLIDRYLSLQESENIEHIEKDATDVIAVYALG